MKVCKKNLCLPFIFFSLALLPLISSSVLGQQKSVANDLNAPLHLLKANYRNPYGIPHNDSVKLVLNRILSYLDNETPYQLIDGNKNAVTTKNIDQYTSLKPGAFRLTSYEWGVTYAGMLLAGSATKDSAFTAYTSRRLKFLNEVAPVFSAKNSKEKQLERFIAPHALDDAGAICVAYIKLALQTRSAEYDQVIDKLMNWITKRQFRLNDGTLARNRPHQNTLWLDDMFMGIPAMAWMGRFKNDNTYYDEAVKQVRLFSARMFVPEKNLFMHGWVEGMQEHPGFFWARANGWALMTLVEVLEALPKEHPGYSEVLTLLRKHVKGITALQSGDGLWHQLLDRNDSYLETSASAIYTYAMAHAINRGWIDFKAYGPTVLLAWNAVANQVNNKGQVQGVCVGTGMAFDPAYYYYRPISVYAAHGYGPVLLAGAAISELLQQKHPKMNDSALQFYGEKIDTKAPIFDEN